MQNQQIDLNNIDKSDWQTYRFEEIASSITERVDPNNTDLKVYIGLEHLDPETIHIRRFGTPEDVKGQKLKCYPGDIIFGKRRAYQRKAAIVKKEGFCSAHSMVLRANPDVIDPKLFPFFLHSDQFMHRAVDISVGSLSPTINWGTLKNQKFLLPLKDQQAQLAALLWALEEVKVSEVNVLSRLRTAFDSLVIEKCLDVTGRTVKLSEIIDKLDAGVSVNSEDGLVSDKTNGILKTSAVSEGFFNPKEVKKVKESEISRLTTKVKKGAIIISRMNTVELVGANAYVEKEYPNMYLPDRLWQTSISRKDVNTRFLWFVLSSPRYRRKISALCTGTSNSMKNISKQSFLGLTLTLPEKNLQDNSVSEIDRILLYLSKAEEKAFFSQSLQKSINHQIF